MKIIKLEDCPEFAAADGTLLKEILHPDKAPLDLRYSLVRAILPAGKSCRKHSLTTSEVFYIIRGKGEMHIDDEVKAISQGDTVYIPPNSKQFIKNNGSEELEFLAIVDPAWKIENETVHD